MRKLPAALSAIAIAFSLTGLAAVSQAPATPTAAVPASEDARLTAFLDAEFAELVKRQPQLATRLGLKDGGDRWNDIGDAAAAEMRVQHAADRHGSHGNRQYRTDPHPGRLRR